MKYYTLVCPHSPDCSYTGQGNSKRFMERVYFEHFMEEHYLKPIVYEKEKRPKVKKRTI